MAGDNETIHFPKFDGKNFSQWRFRVDLLLEEKQMKQFIQKDLNTLIIEKDEKTTDSELIAKEAKCKSLLARTINDEQLTYIMGKTNAKAMYDALVAMFERKSVANQLILRRRLLTMKFLGGDINDHFLQFDNTIRELRLAGAKLEEMDTVVNLMLTLPKSYDALVTSLEGMDEAKLTLQYVKSRLLDEFAKRNNGTTQLKANEACAMQTTNPNIICFNCGKQGHIKSRCRAKRQHKSKNNSSKKESSANNASKDSGNKDILCAIRDDEKEAFTTQRCGHGNNDDSSNDACAMNSGKAAHKCTAKHSRTQKLKSDDATKIKFVLDSGATDHMANNREYFDDLVNVDEIDISTAKKK